MAKTTGSSSSGSAASDSANPSADTPRVNMSWSEPRCNRSRSMAAAWPCQPPSMVAAPRRVVARRVPSSRAARVERRCGVRRRSGTRYGRTKPSGGLNGSRTVAGGSMIRPPVRSSRSLRSASPRASLSPSGGSWLAASRRATTGPAQAGGHPAADARAGTTSRSHCRSKSMKPNLATESRRGSAMRRISDSGTLIIKAPNSRRTCAGAPTRLLIPAARSATSPGEPTSFAGP